MATCILGISACSHDSAAALFVDGRMVAAGVESRFTGKPKEFHFPTQTVRHCLREAALKADSLDYVGFFGRPRTRFTRFIELIIAGWPRTRSGFLSSLPFWLRTGLHLPDVLRRELDGYHGPVLFADQSAALAASGFFRSPFAAAALLVQEDGGEGVGMSLGVGRAGRIAISQQQQYPHSLSFLESAVEEWIGISDRSTTLRTMGALGAPRFATALQENVIELKADGSFKLNMDYLNCMPGQARAKASLQKVWDGPPLKRGAARGQRELDLAASMLAVRAEVLRRSAAYLRKQSACEQLVYCGGFPEDKYSLREAFEQVWMPPEPVEAVGAVGVALLIGHHLLDHPRFTPGHWAERDFELVTS